MTGGGKSDAIAKLRQISVVLRGAYIDLFENGEFITRSSVPDGIDESVFIDAFSEKVHALRVERTVIIELMFTCWSLGG